jgi:hypothetical protein
VLYDLKTITADGAGNSSGTASASTVTTDQPSSGWYIDLHNGAGGSAFDQLVLTCAAMQPVFQGHLKRSKQVHLHEWMTRSLIARLKENLSRLTAALR